MNIILTFWSNRLRLSDFNFISTFNWNICNSININNLCWFLRNVILFVDLNYGIWRRNNFINWSKFFSIFLWNYINWNVSYVFKIKSLNESFFNWCYRCKMGNFCFWSFVDWNVFDSIENNWTYNFVGNWNKALTVYYNHMSCKVWNLSFFYYQILFENSSVNFWDLF